MHLNREIAYLSNNAMAFIAGSIGSYTDRPSKIIGFREV